VNKIKIAFFVFVLAAIRYYWNYFFNTAAHLYFQTAHHLFVAVFVCIFFAKKTKVVCYGFGTFLFRGCFTAIFGELFFIAGLVSF